MKFKKMVCGVIPAFLLAVSVGQIYAFTIFSDSIASRIGAEPSKVQFAFSLGIFFLGMGAAFFGRYVEKDIRKAVRIGSTLFLAGLATTCMGVYWKSLWTVYAGYGAMLGLGTGIIYISPVKTLMMWFPKNKAVASAVSIISFGLGSSLCVLMVNLMRGMSWCNEYTVFLGMMAMYLPMMVSGYYMLRKPREGELEGKEGEGAVYGGFHVEKDKGIVANGDANECKIRDEEGFSYAKLLKDKFFISSWMFMFLNISCGLSLIPLSKQMMSMESVGYSAAVITAVITGCGLMNGGGRFVFAWISDRMQTRANVLALILYLSVIVTLVAAWDLRTVGVCMLVINACYGAGFSTIPAVLADHYGMNNLSKIHGAVLSAWGVAGLVGNQVAIAIMGNFGAAWLLMALCFVYGVTSFAVMVIKGKL